MTVTYCMNLLVSTTPQYCDVTFILVYHACGSNLESKSQDKKNQQVNWLANLEIYKGKKKSRLVGCPVLDDLT